MTMLAGWAVSASAPLADAVVDGDGLAVLIVYFGPLPPWLPLTLASMAANPTVSFSVVGDAPPPRTGLPSNVRFETVGWVEMQARLGALSGRQVSYTMQYKANDIKPLLPELYPHLLAGRSWWAWSDLDVVYGDLRAHMAIALRAPACCAGRELQCSKRLRRDRRSPCFNSSRAPPGRSADTWRDARACPCTAGERVTAVSPLYPNPWRKKCWGPFTAFRVEGGASAAGVRPPAATTSLFRRAPKWRQIVGTAEYTHFDEWWGPLSARGLETMGDVMTRLSDAGELVMSRALLPFAEAKSCADVECTFCPCGALRFELRGGKLFVNEREAMLLHLSESKPAWREHARRHPLPPWRAGAQPECVRVSGLGAFAPDDALGAVGALLRRRTALRRHRPLSEKAAPHLLYGDAALALPGAERLNISVGECAESAFDDSGDVSGGGGGGGAPPAAGAMALARARRDFDALAARYAAAVAAERAHSLRWICAWARLAAVYRSLVSRVEPGHPAAAKLPGLNGNRRVRTPLWAGERLGWWRQSPTWAVHDWGGRADDRPPDAGGEHRACLCSAPAAPAGSCLAEGGAHSCARPLDARGAPIGQPCLGKRVDGRPSCGERCGAAELLNELLDGYFALLNRQAVLAIRSQRWRCSWLYKLRACWTAEGLATHADPERPLPSSGAACASVLPPQDKGRLGWGSANPANLTRGELDSLLYRWRCW